MDFNSRGKEKNVLQVELIAPTPAQIELQPSLKGATLAEFTATSPAQNVAAGFIAGNGPDNALYVRLFTDDKSRTVTAVTLGNHGIVGIRQWQVKASIQQENWSGGYHTIKKCDAVLRISTSAWEQRSGPGTDAAYWWFGGQDVGKTAWSFYLNTVCGQVQSQTDVIAKSWLEQYQDRELGASTKNPHSKELPAEFQQP